MRNAPRTLYLLSIQCTVNSEHVKLNVFEKDDFLPTSLLDLCIKRHSIGRESGSFIMLIS